MIPDVPDRWEVDGMDNWPGAGRHPMQSALVWRIDQIITALARIGIEPDEITIDIDRRAVVIRRDTTIILRAL